MRKPAAGLCKHCTSSERAFHAAVIVSSPAVRVVRLPEAGKVNARHARNTKLQLSQQDQLSQLARQPATRRLFFSTGTQQLGIELRYSQLSGPQTSFPRQPFSTPLSQKERCAKGDVRIACGVGAPRAAFTRREGRATHLVTHSCDRCYTPVPKEVWWDHWTKFQHLRRA